MENTIKFETGKTYFTRSICDSDMIITATIMRRTAKSVWTKNKFGEVQRFGLYTFMSVETFRPWGSGSMMPTIGADRESK